MNTLGRIIAIISLAIIVVVTLITIAGLNVMWHEKSTTELVTYACWSVRVLTYPIIIVCIWAVVRSHKPSTAKTVNPHERVEP